MINYHDVKKENINKPDSNYQQKAKSNLKAF